MMRPRVVITGMGVVAPNGVGLSNFLEALKAGKSGIRFLDELESAQFACKIGGVPPGVEALLEGYFSPVTLRNLRSTHIKYGCIAGVDAWRDAGLSLTDPKASEPDWDSGCVFGIGVPGVETWHRVISMVDSQQVKRLGSGVIDQGMTSGISAYLGGLLGLGNQVTTNAAACSTGTEAVLIGADRIRAGRAKRVLVGSCEGPGPYIWGPFDSMRILNRRYNDDPTRASRPMSASAKGFVPGSGAGALVLEELETALARGARIYAEVKGGAVNSGGQRGGGSMTAPNPQGIDRCIRMALDDASTSGEEIDGICGHLTATMGDPIEVANWTKALGRKGADFPYINSLKSMIGHCLSAAGSIETVAAVLQLYYGFFHASLNCEDLHPDITNLIRPDRVPQETLYTDDLRTLAKASFGFGDVNACLILQRWG